MNILHAPNNITGTPRKLAELERKEGFKSDSINTTITEIDGPSHFNSANDLFSKILFRFKYLYLAITYYDVVNFHAGASLLPFNLDLPILRLFNKKIIFHYYGSEVRIIKEFKKVNPYFNLLEIDGKNNSLIDKKKKRKIKWQSTWAHYGIAPRDSYYFISKIYDQNKIVELWSANILSRELKELSAKKIISQNKVPMIIHCPTNRLTKGTAYVDKALESLKRKGFKFIYKSIENMEKTDLQEFIREKADIVIDQFLIGTFGNLAIETLALGKISVGYLNEDLCLQFSKDCPIVNATVDTLEVELGKLIEDINLRNSISIKGPDFIQVKLNEKIIIDKLTSLYNL